MRQFLVVPLIFLFSLLANADDLVLDQAHEAINYLQTYRDLETKGWATEESRYAQSTYNHTLKELFLQHSRLFFSEEITTRWFDLPQASSEDFRFLAGQYIGLMSLEYVGDEALLKHLTEMGFPLFMQRLFPNKTHAERRQWILARKQKWQKEQTKLLRSNSGIKRRQALRLVFDLNQNGTLIKNFLETLVSPLTVDQKRRLAQEMIFQPKMSLQVKSEMVVYFLKTIPWNVWKSEDIQLLRKILLKFRDIHMVAEKVVDFLRENPGYSRERFTLITEASFELTARGLINPRAGMPLTVLEQVYSLSDTYRSTIALKFINAENSSWTLDLLDFHFLKGYGFSAALGSLLGRDYVVEDRRWADWVVKAPKEIIPHFSALLSTIDKFYTLDSKEAMRLYNDVFADFRLKAVQGRKEPLVSFIKSAYKNPQMMEAFVERWGDKVVLIDDKPVLDSFVKSIMSQYHVDDNTRLHWLNLILMRRELSQTTLLRLAQMFGTLHTLNFDFMRDPKTGEYNAEDLRASLESFLMKDGSFRARIGPLRCQAVFAF